MFVTFILKCGLFTDIFLFPSVLRICGGFWCWPKADNLNFVLVESDNKTSCEQEHCVQIQGIVTHGYSFDISESSSRLCCCHRGTVGRRFQLPSRWIHITFAFADCWATRSFNSYGVWLVYITFCSRWWENSALSHRLQQGFEHLPFHAFV